ncbi:WAT1-related protein At4g30420 isoform X2 [Amborella trichopoda]|uniref:WAT1-related protein n=1 Tax=Amborella trichopoda TaxID=13333 RepID=W1NY80_AMBTC|nr:WAT1-related protein At4g30420 isoform X2 [Amborella trichopoda]ERM99644.1 hypothetical protein AMTR_s00088p00179990 [Amborella trichopoda]|eukprot:XP_006836791.1 WAT1-related protein At4g30420 isoform X2 [Amborella trichopoda]
MEEYMPIFAQIMVQVFLAGMQLLTKIAFSHGLDFYIFTTYRTIIGTLAIFPFAYFMERERRPALRIKTAAHMFLLALIGISVAQNCYFMGLYYTSSTLAATVLNLIPVVTFVMAFFLGIEALDLRCRRGQAKIVGTCFCVGGAMVMTLLKGSAIKMLNISKSPTSFLWLSDASLYSKWAFGTASLSASVLAWSAWINYQALVLKQYPAQLSMTGIMCFMGSIQSAIIALVTKESTAWRVGWNVELLSCVYTGVMCTAIAYMVQSWCIKKKGPLFSSSFNPVCTVIVAVLEPILFHVDIHVGSLVGMVMIIFGLYGVLWGKAGDMNKKQGMRNEEAEGHASQSRDEEANVVGLQEPLFK